LSPLLFFIYYDNHLLSLRSKGVGCHVGGFFGALAYADDTVLLASSANAMLQMLLACDSYAAEFNLSFNAAKSKCLFFSFP
jgi:Reverse transcriptase (RNA-dependent DNA polymerase)